MRMIYADNAATTAVSAHVLQEMLPYYSEQYGNITVNIVAAGLTDYTVQCYRLKGEGAADLKIGDVITVTGTIKNYKCTIEFDSGCQIVK